jgi:polygalacturonase
MASRSIIAALLTLSAAAAAAAAAAASSASSSSAAAAACSVLAYGARCDNRTDDAPAIQRALDDAACAAVVVPAGSACVSRALNVSRMSGRALTVDGELAIWRDPKTYSRTKAVNMFISATDGDGSWTGALLSRFSLGGEGRIVGGGAAWWASEPNRPRILWLPNASDVRVWGLTLVDSPAWNIGMRGDNLLVEGVRVEAGAASCAGFALAKNTDGANVGGRNITVRDFWVHNGDDCVPITTGNDGATSDVLVENVHCECGTNGVVIYNQGGSIRNVVARNVSVVGTNQGAGVKLARPGRDATGGLVENVSFVDYAIDRPRYAALYVNVFQEDAQPPCVLPSKPDLPNWLAVRALRFANVTATVLDGQAAGCFRCTPGAPCDAAFDGVDVREQGGAPAAPFVCLNMHADAGGGRSTPAACPPAAK